jgi:hypothetical protein
MQQTLPNLTRLSLTVAADPDHNEVEPSVVRPKNVQRGEEEEFRPPAPPGWKRRRNASAPQDVVRRPAMKAAEEQEAAGADEKYKKAREKFTQQQGVLETLRNAKVPLQEKVSRVHSSYNELAISFLSVLADPGNLQYFSDAIWYNRNPRLVMKWCELGENINALGQSLITEGYFRDDNGWWMKIDDTVTRGSILRVGKRGETFAARVGKVVRELKALTDWFERAIHEQRNGAGGPEYRATGRGEFSYITEGPAHGPATKPSGGGGAGDGESDGESGAGGGESGGGGEFDGESDGESGAGDGESDGGGAGDGESDGGSIVFKDHGWYGEGVDRGGGGGGDGAGDGTVV